MLTLKNEALQVLVDPEHGGRIVSFVELRGGTEFVCYDPRRLPVDPSLDYDGNFAGGFDELLPNDPPEDGFPDHGELWTLPLTAEWEKNALRLSGTLPLSRLRYERRMCLDGNALISEYRLVNTGKRPLDFLWKLHAALRIAEGDCFMAPAGCVQAADPGEWSLAADGMPRRWPGKYPIPGRNGRSDFFYLTDLDRGELVLKRADGHVFTCRYAPEVFACAWVFASFGRLNDAYTLIMEPATNYPCSLAGARQSRTCAGLNPGETLAATVRWQAE